MKKLILILFIFTLFLTACTDDPITEDVNCTDTQVEVDKVCVDLTGTEIQLRRVIEFTKTIDNYKLDITISEGIDELNILMMFDDNVSSISTLNQVDYFINNDNICEHILVVNDFIETKDYDCFNGDYYSLFKDLEYSWFSLVNGKYILNVDKYEDVGLFFIDEFPLSYIESFTMSVGAESISNMVIELNVEDSVYLIDIVISSIGLITIEIPEGE